MISSVTSLVLYAGALAAVLFASAFGVARPTAATAAPEGGLAAPAGELPRTIVWKATFKPSVGSPTPYPSVTAADSVVVPTASGVARINGKGQVVFEYDMGDLVGAMAACGDVDGDGATEIVAGTVRGRIVCLTGEGKAKWTYEVRHPFVDYANVVIAHRQGHAVADILIKGQDGWLTCLDGKGRYRWNLKIVGPGQISAPAVGDLDGDGDPEYVCGIEGGIIALSSEGRLLWQYANENEFARQVAVIADADRDGKPEVYILMNGATSAVFCLDGATGKQLWTVPIPAKCYCALTVADINGDGYDEILYGTKYSDIVALDHTGRSLWKTTVGGNGIFTNPIVADLDGDGNLEIVYGVRAASADGKSLYVLDTQGNLRGGYPQDNEGNSAPVIADLDRDGLLEVVSCSSDTVWCCRFGNPTKLGRAPWPCYRGNAELTGCQLPRRAPKGKAAAAQEAAPKGLLLPKTFETILGETKVNATWTVATPKVSYVEAVVTNPLGMQSTRYFRTPPQTKSVEVVFPFNHGGRYTIEARLYDPENQRALLAEVRQVNYAPLGAEQAMVEAAEKRLTPSPSTVSASPQIAGELRRRAAVLSATFETLKARVAALQGHPEASLQGRRRAAVPPTAEFPPEVIAAAAALRAQVARDTRYAALAGKTAAASPGMLFAAWQDPDPWDYVDPRDELPPAVSEKAASSAWCYGNQREDFCFNLVGFNPEPFSVRVEPEDLLGPEGAKAPWEKHLTLCQVVWMPTIHSPDEVPDMLPKMNSGRTVQLAPGGFAQVWLVLDTKDLAPGNWTVNLRFQSLTMAAAAVDASLNVEVLSVALPYPYPWKMCNWSWPTSYPEPLQDRVIEDLISHGSNVMYAPAPSRSCDAEGRLVGEVDWSALDHLAAKAKPGDPFFFFTGLPMRAPEGMGQDSPIWKKAFQEWMREFVEHLASIGIDRRHYAFYPVDEPGNSGHTSIDQLIAAAKVLREADPQAPIYADPAGAAYTTDWMRELDPWIDVWQPATSVAARKDLVEIMDTRHRQVWMYEAPGNVRVLSPLGFYRRQPWLALRDGVRGSGFWVYYYSNLWSVGKTKEPDYGTVWIDRDEVVDSRRWQAAHDGVQDATAVLMLDEAIADAEKAGVDPALCARAKQVRATAIAEVTINADPDADTQWDVLQRNRRLIADTTIALREALAAKPH